ncbi:MAG: hypothetical protein IJ572_00260 [Bacilli bacterium]|nr:hypothetical protein [Bacilli bacterium]
MGKKIANKIKGNFKYYYGTYFGKYNGYDISIRYDYASMLYNIYFNVKGSTNIDKLNKLLSKIDEYAVAKYNNNNLTITEACDSSKDIPNLANNILDEVTTYLGKNKYKNLCKMCGEESETFLVDIDGNVMYACDKCIRKTSEKYEKELEEKNSIKEDIFLGIIGAIVGCIPGLIIWFILSYLRIDPTVIGLIIMLGSAYFYRWFANSMKLPGLIISLLIGFVAIIFANEITNAYALYTDYVNQYNINIFDAYKAMPYYLGNNELFRSSYNQSLTLSIMFGIFGGLTNLGVYRRYIANNKIKKLEVK